MRTASPDEFNGQAFDTFTAVHFASGCVLGVLGCSFRQATIAAIGWEIVERPIKDHAPQLFPHPLQDRPINIVTDAIAVVGGWYVARSLIRYLRQKQLRSERRASPEVGRSCPPAVNSSSCEATSCTATK